MLDKRLAKLESKRAPKREFGLLLVRPNPGESAEEAISRTKAESADFMENHKEVICFYLGFRQTSKGA